MRALDNVTLDVRPGGITGLIGPNGSGKTTLINAVTGIQAMVRGSVHLDGQSLDGLAAYRRARLGLARTFQAIRLFDTLSVIDNVMLGAQRLMRSGLVESTLRTPRSRLELRQQRARAEELLSLFGDRLLPRLNNPVASLSYANRRRAEISRAVMAEPSVLLLDEPMAGMNPSESWELADQIPLLLDRYVGSILLVEHKIDIITHLCSTVFVLDHGVCLAEGDPETIQKDPAVAEAFLGVE